ncbi:MULTISPECIES: DUF1190 domain-containing protein [Pseudoalteromonas]|uniref:DUF1190 domain-containing protein n=1 Tax=Pseudoalteromonas ruthenica TaxID=151081 RepID=A0A0F4PH72_9GAMM|nr:MULTISPECIES: DUF1190 domain-containing protein [Pseudoalteromonas]KJY94820.1 lipoprotein [Pseudoalteromonas ruthenica]KJY98320.1 lipoprotein [Pseudoalteromonas ruthenica]MCF2862437.1 DUF1190 domain-containing protein [Pseudoalteromonas sp. CNAT2-18]MCG7545069.1 DUF1190 domain-containing protein [Pseudoalteromonas sp. MM17-2]MCG7557794.1 DUF1190 domain-containing protein [Pseudoalteromonas sp. CNAT2-18.1]
MKRTNKLKLTLMLGASAGLSGCTDPEEPALLFTDVDDCTDFGVERDVCQAQYQQALANHDIEAPKYANENLCENDFGFERCEQEGSIWRPIMAGFMIAAVAEAVDEGLDLMKKKKKRKKYAFLGGNYYSGAKPLYRSRDDFFSFRNANNDYIGSVNNRGTTMVKKSKVKYASKPKRVTRSRGGFGRRASSRSFGG